MSGRSGVVERRKDTRGPLLLNELTDDSVVKVCRRCVQMGGTPKRRCFFSHLIGVHLICSRTYSSCSVLSVSSMKICCNFSLT